MHVIVPKVWKYTIVYSTQVLDVAEELEVFYSVEIILKN